MEHDIPESDVIGLHITFGYRPYRVIIFYLFEVYLYFLPKSTPDLLDGQVDF